MWFKILFILFLQFFFLDNNTVPIIATNSNIEQIQTEPYIHLRVFTNTFID
jgi:hypothetical protein